MSYVEWDPALETGNTIVDEQHQELFSMINDLRDACVNGSGKEATEDILQRLSQYVVQHFTREELLMIESAYPDTEMHVAAHRKLRERTAELTDEYHSGKMVTVLPLAEFLFEWLKTHIRNVDAHLVTHLKTQRAGGY